MRQTGIEIDYFATSQQLIDEIVPLKYTRINLHIVANFTNIQTTFLVNEIPKAQAKNGLWAEWKRVINSN